MEERIIDDEYGRGIRLKKTKEGYVDVTDELAENAEESETAEATETEEAVDELEESLEDTQAEAEEEAGEEVSFEFPELEEDDEDLVNLSPEEAIALRKKKEAEEAERKAEYARLCAEGEEFLLSGGYKAAELKFEKALTLAEDATEAAVGYWRAKTSDFSEPDVLADEYLETGYESLEADLGDDAVLRLKKEYGEVFKARIAQLEEEEKPLAATVEEKQSKRGVALKARLSSAVKREVAAGLPALALLVCTVVFIGLITSRPDQLFLYLAIASGVAFGVVFIVFGVFTNRLLNVLRLNKANSDLSSTEDGKQLLRLRAYRDFYGNFID